MGVTLMPVDSCKVIPGILFSSPMLYIIHSISTDLLTENFI